MSVRKDGSWMRSQRLVQISKQIAKDFNDGGKCSFEDLLLWIEFEIGLTEATARKYVDTIIRAKRWKLQDGFILPSEVKLK